eukprot:TRINITY_DN935_c0_g1_i7.p1 TRINITY_DN935_c0_g1~~TRINITY_DN935_c0_g1_i7.p1  ORF type:complete len:716 (-),score=138.71 TRINITY_DN935_c0_g1_i7:110-2257(-)
MIAVVDVISKLLGVDSQNLFNALLMRSISTGYSAAKSVIHIRNNREQAEQTRDALAKGIYDRLFTWIVQKINKTLSVENQDQLLSLGLLDIYGFEIFDNNSFEQFCINLCNEKLQQLFIEMTLKSEQEEYQREGISWTPVKYFDNKIICDLIEAVKPKPGIIALIDQCVITNHDDKHLMEILDQNLKGHDHYTSWATSRDKAMADGQFRVKHYAGDVVYRLDGFIEKSKDTLYMDLVVTMQKSEFGVVQELFGDVEIGSTNKRTQTAGVQFKNALAALVTRLLQANPHYVRCIKPNEVKQPRNVNETRTRHQIKYLGLVENVRVRRAGFAFRREYDRFLLRYKMLAKETWPIYRGSDKEGVHFLMSSLRFTSGEFEMGKSKIFIKEPKTVFKLEELRNQKIPGIVVRMQKTIRGYIDRKRFNKTRALHRIAGFFRWARSQKHMVTVLNTFKQVETSPNCGLDIPWPEAPQVLVRSQSALQIIQQRWWAQSLVFKIPQASLPVVKQKVLAYEIFYDKKPWNPCREWQALYLEKPTNPHLAAYKKAMEMHFSSHGDQSVHFCDYGDKLNSSHKLERRGIVVTDINIYKHNPKNFKVRANKAIPIADIQNVVLYTGYDQWVLIHTKSSNHQDLLISLLSEKDEERVSELVTVLSQVYLTRTGNHLPVSFEEKSTFRGAANKPGIQIHFIPIDGDVDPKSRVKKGGNQVTLPSPRGTRK